MVYQLKYRLLNGIKCDTTSKISGGLFICIDEMNKKKRIKFNKDCIFVRNGRLIEFWKYL